MIPKFIAERYELAVTAAVQVFGVRCLESILRLAAARSAAIYQLENAWTHATIFTAILVTNDNPVGARNEAQKAVQAATEACDLGYDKVVDAYQSVLTQATVTGNDIVLDAFVLFDQSSSLQTGQNIQKDFEQSTNMYAQDVDYCANRFQDAARCCIDQLAASANTGAELCRRDAQAIRVALDAYECEKEHNDIRNAFHAFLNFLDAREAALAAEDALIKIKQQSYLRDRQAFALALSEIKGTQKFYAQEKNILSESKQHQQQHTNVHAILDTMEALCETEKSLAKVSIDQAERGSRRAREASERTSRIRRDFKTRQNRSQSTLQKLRSKLEPRLNNLSNVLRALETDANLILTQIKPWLCDHLVHNLFLPTLHFTHRDAQTLNALAKKIQYYVASTWLHSDSNLQFHQALIAYQQRAEEDLLRSAELSRSSAITYTVSDANIALEDARTRLRDHDADITFFQQVLAVTNNCTLQVGDFASLSSTLLDFFKHSVANSPFTTNIVPPTIL
eukprot:CAMPEP_0197317570 /NCGR_PEP_ID=MMETSP0891-20130614/47591_1 /TAXON_ID=44058 ORGANISM="Aureoumbra lagunensis, Strain CCMP1510" /NCGR_SAMPLE_ID=MMETSP0891 /ASSEMBLY_ACC=CAM_ASM_000534 /LENGTH=508 /DNA_ID=CAMNT_0042807617 /DNA_START=236 /DNA_END=1762 /DNA_ORIENTATION=+